MAKTLEIQIPFDAAWEKVCAATGWKHYRQLGNFLGITSATISSAKSRGFFPISWAFQLAKKFNLSLDILALDRGDSKSFSIDESAPEYRSDPVQASAAGYKVRRKYRAKNSLGGYAIENKVFSLNKNGDVIKMEDFKS